jgi:hypothetical protein
MGVLITEGENENGARRFAALAEHELHDRATTHYDRNEPIIP